MESVQNEPIYLPELNIPVLHMPREDSLGWTDSVVWFEFLMRFMIEFRMNHCCIIDQWYEPIQ